MAKPSRNQQILSERLAVSFSAEQMRPLEQIARTSAMLGESQSLAEVVRNAVNHYLIQAELNPSVYEKKLEDLSEEISLLRMELRRYIVDKRNI